MKFVRKRFDIHLNLFQGEKQFIQINIIIRDLDNNIDNETRIKLD